MFRDFVLPLASSETSIWNLLVNNGYCDSLGNMLVSSVKNGMIIPDRISQLDVRPADGNTGIVTYADNFTVPSTAQQLGNLSKRSNRNSICLKDYLFADSSGGDALVVEIESI